VLNERCRVFLDLAEILADNNADAKMSYITWIIIILIVISIIVTVTEVGLRFGMLSQAKGREGGGAGNVIGGDRLDLRSLERLGATANVTLDDLRLWSALLSEQEKAAVCGGEFVGRTFGGV
jgi:hypothetical protein